jgi:hypothetical protein
VVRADGTVGSARVTRGLARPDERAVAAVDSGALRPRGASASQWTSRRVAMEFNLR